MKHALLIWICLASMAAADFVLLVERDAWREDREAITREIRPFIPDGAIVGEPTWSLYKGTTNHVWGVMRWTGVMVERELQHREAQAHRLTDDKLPAIRVRIPSASTNLTISAVSRGDLDPVVAERGKSILMFTDDYTDLLRRADLREIPGEEFP